MSFVSFRRHRITKNEGQRKGLEEGVLSGGQDRISS